MITANDLEMIRQLFQDPKPFIHAAVARIIKFGYGGYNVNFQPEQTANQQDAIDYANFLDVFADAIHDAGFRMSVDVGK